MKRINHAAVAALLSLTASAMAFESGAAQRGASSERDEQARTVTVLHTNDIHGHLQSWIGWEGELAGRTLGGIDRIAARVREIRAEAGAGQVMLLDAGDTIGDTLLAAETEGRALIEAMNAVGYDAMVIGNHEPDFTAEKLKARIDEARFPVVAANIVGRGGRLFTRPYVLKNVAGVRLGILGIAYPNTPLTTAKRNVKGLRFRDAVETARKYVPIMRREGAEIIVALTHLGLSADKKLAEAVRGIDVIVGGHSHNRMKDALRVGDTLVVHAGAHGSDLGRLDLVVTGGRIVSHRRTLIEITGEIAPDADVAAVIARHRREHESKMFERVGVAKNVVARAQTIAGQEPEPRDRESPADSLFADAIRAETGTQIAFLPGVGYGIALQAGEITAASLRNLIPHDSAIWTMVLDGGQIRDVLEQSVENVVTQDVTKKVGGMIQVSGLRFSYEPSAPKGKRVRDIEVDGKRLARGTRYTVAVNALLAEGGHKYAAFKSGAVRAEAGKQYDMVRAWLGRAGEIEAPSAPRITRLSEGK